MYKLKRFYSTGNLYFISVVTYKRRPILLENIDIFWQAIDRATSAGKFEIIAWVINPDHFHMVLDPMKHNLSELIKRLKLSFSMNYRKKIDRHEGRVWQYRFWDHVIRDNNDLNEHIDYIHYNPVKHGLVESPFEYEHSSIGKFSEFYPHDWGVAEKIEYDDDFGE